jgi:Holliday junction resolvase RusA-like endonuclease
MPALLIVRVDGVPGPKGSVNAFCVRCAKKRLPPAVVIKEQSEVGAAFRKAIARELRNHPMQMITMPVKTRATFFIHRQRMVRAGVTSSQWVPSHRTIVPIHHGSGDVEKHTRTLHDALQDAGVLADDCIVSDIDHRKRWADDANPPGMVFEIRETVL